jgi:hypothetical protein
MNKTIATLLTIAAAGVALAGCSAPLADTTVLIRSEVNLRGLMMSADMPTPFSEEYSTKRLQCTTVSYKNRSEDDESFNPYDWTLRDTKGVVVSHWPMSGEKYLSSGNLVPGGERTGDVCFAQEGDGKPAAVIYDGPSQVTFAIR